MLTRSLTLSLAQSLLVKLIKPNAGHYDGKGSAMKNPVNLLPVSAAVAVAISATLLLGSAGSAFAANTVAESGPGDAVGSSGFLRESWAPCTPAAAQSLFAIEDASAKGTLTSDVVSKPCAQSATSAIRIADLSSVNPVGRSPVAATDQTAAAAASSPPNATPALGEQLGEVVVTGSRIPRRDYEANAPIVTVSDDAIKQTGEVSVEMALQQLPQFMPDMNATDPLLSNGGRANVDLRGLGANRTLVLLDGRRMQSSDPTGVIDLNTLPSTVIQSVEVISGGASAVYGSDAIAGVVNFKTRDNFQGIELDAQYGETTRRDAGNEQFTITLGDNFADNKGNAYIALDFMKRDLVLEHSRPFFANANPQAVLPQGSFTVDPTNLPTQAAVNTAFAAYGVAPGTVLNTRSLGFNDYGGPITLFPLTGPIVNYTGPQGPYILTTPTSVTSAAGQFISLVQPIDRYAIFSKLHYDLTDNVTAYSQFYFSQNDVFTTAGPATVTMSIATNNPFIPAAIKPILASRPNPTAPFTFTQIAGYLGSRSFGYRYSTFQMLQGFKGDFDLFNGSKWNWDVYASYGTTTDIFTTTNSTDQNVVNLLTGAADGGASQGCAFNPFIYNNSITQDGTISAGCLKLLERQPKDETDLQQKEIQGSLGGPIAKLPAGDVQVSLTAGFRGYGYIFKPDALGFSELAAGGTNFAVYTNATDSTKETSLEVEIPLLKDMPFAKVLNLNVAGRYSDYRSTGGSATYKADMEWAPISQFRFRSGYERALRAPNPSELFGAASQVQTTVGSPPGAGDPCDVRNTQTSAANIAQLRTLCIATGVPAALANSYQFTRTTTGASTEGNPNVKPEIADTYTLGGVWSQDLGSLNVRFSVDWYDIEVRRAISTIPLQTIINNCYNLNGGNPTYSASNFYCALIARNPVDGTPSNVLLANQNVGGFRTKGIDFETDLRYPLPIGALLFNGTLNYTYDWDIQNLPGTPWQTANGEVVPTVSVLSPLTPKIRGLFRPSYEYGPFRIGARIQYIASMVDPTFFANPKTALPGVPAYIYYGLDANYRLGKTYNFRAGIDNIANKGPPILRGTAGVTSPTTYDTVGRRFYIGATADF
jgi:iron complex outermembrane receptor protein